VIEIVERDNRCRHDVARAGHRSKWHA
jgi:hypothetical protein